MFVTQISVFLENQKGTLARLTRVLGDEKIDLIALSIADTENYGILRCIVADTDRAFNVIREAGYTVRRTNVLAIQVPDRPGGLAEVLEMLDSAEISIEYLYSFVKKSGDNALVIFRVTDNEKALSVLKQKGIVLLDQEKINQL